MFNTNNPDTLGDDEALILLSKQKDKEAFTIIYQKYHQYLYALAYRFLKDSDMAEDAVQQVFVKLGTYPRNRSRHQPEKLPL